MKSHDAVLKIGNFIYYSNVIKINRGVKQGGVLSSFLFNIFIKDLLVKCKGLEIGATMNGYNISILAYCDDILLISPSLKQLQLLLDVASMYSHLWMIKFNTSKCSVINAGLKLYPDCEIDVLLNKMCLNVVSELKYLGLFFNDKNDFNNQIINKFTTVSKCYYSLNKFGISPNGIAPHAKSFLYKNFCLSKATYSLGLTNLTKSTINTLNVLQNNMIRYTLGLEYKCHINNV